MGFPHIKPMNLSPVELDLEHVKGWNNTPKPSSNLPSLIESIRNGGMHTPIAVQKGTNILIAGHGRVLACRELKKTTILAYLLDCEPDSPEARLHVIDSELEHAKPSVLEEALLRDERKNIYLEIHPQTKRGVA